MKEKNTLDLSEQSQNEKQKQRKKQGGEKNLHKYSDLEGFLWSQA